MKPPRPQQQSADYGIDAPEVLRRFLMIGTVALVLNFAAPSIMGLLPATAAPGFQALARSLGWMGWGFIATACVMLWGSRVGKLRLRDRLLSSMSWRGDEQVLDVGCGHGLMLVGIARRLRESRVIGIDIWRADDLAHNGPESALRNARLEGVAGRVEVRTADARALPFDAGRFDAVVSSWMLHNIAERDGRRRALEEMARVLRPGGQIALVDIRHIQEYAAVLAALGFTGLKIGAPNLMFITPTRVLMARKPA